MESPNQEGFTEMEMEMEEDVESTSTLRGMLEDMVYDAEDESHKIDELFSYVCAICDDGGEILCCEGRCLRSFHATKEAGEASGCKSLCFKHGWAEEMPTYLCKNCEYKQHQCYACGKLGSSDKSSGAEVFPCASAICGRFYHPYCVAKLLCQRNGKAAEELEKKISIGDYFTCPIHKCSVCKEGENKTVHELQLAVCMRCPQSYHRKCLPRKHAIERETGCATREHLKYPGVEEKQRRPALQSPVGREKFLAKQRASEDLYRGRRTAPAISNQEKKLSFSVDLGNADVPSAESQKRILTMMKKTASSTTLEDVIQKQNLPSTHAYSLKTFINKKIPLGKVEGSTEAVRTALRKLEEGCSTEDAEAICERDVLKQIFAWKNKLGIYLAPFLNGKRYTSFGRHFTKMDKLLEIVNRLHWYVQNGDMIVDFSCGSNDFSTLMKKKLEDTGKNCMYRNYDLFQPQNDFEFVKKDWMTVQREELLTGSQLIIGLNPPFGSSKGILANKFIDKALEFEPKLLILIVPPETERLDEKSSYALIWEDDRLLSGKSFYFPGSIDVNNKQLEQWNERAPPLYLWSHRDWCVQHKAIAVEHGHSFRM